MKLRCIGFGIRCEELFIYLMILQLLLGIYTLVLLRASMIRAQGVKSIEQLNLYPLRDDTERHARKLFAEISNKGFFVPTCEEFKSMGDDICYKFQENLIQPTYKRSTLDGIHSEIFGSCLDLVKRLFKRADTTAPPDSLSCAPSNLNTSPFVNLGDFIFTAQRQWIPTECKNATKVAVIIFDNWPDDEMWKYNLIQNFVLQLQQRRSLHFGIFVIKLEGVRPSESTGNVTHILQLFSGWDQFLFVSFSGKEFSCNISPMKIMSLYQHSPAKHNSNKTPRLGTSPQYIFTNLPTFHATRATRRRPSRVKKLWSLSNLKTSISNQRIIEVAESWPVPEQ